MSHQATTWAMEAPCDTGSEKAVLMVIASYAGADGTCYPGQETIARQACCSVKTVERALRTFEEKGWIERTPRRRADGSRTSDQICVLAANNPEKREQADTVSGCGNMDRPRGEGGSAPQPDILSGRRGATRHPVQANPTLCPNLPDTMSGLTTFEPLEEPLGESLVHSAAASPAPANEGKAAPSKGKRSSIPDGFPTDSDIVAHFDRYEPTAIRQQAERFRNHALQEGRMVFDWRAAWSNWVISAGLPGAERQETHQQGVPPPAHVTGLVAAEKGHDFAEKWLFGAEVDEALQTIVVVSRLAADALNGVQALADWTISKAGAP